MRVEVVQHPPGVLDDLGVLDPQPEQQPAGEGELAGEAGPRRDIAVLNAGAAIYAAGRAASIADGVQAAAEAIDSGAAAAKLDHYVRLSEELASYS